MNGKVKDMLGLRFGRWTVKARSGPHLGKVAWLCKCDCGTERIVSGIGLRRGTSNSCGCLKNELSSKRERIHGLSKTREYNSWRGIRERCINPACKEFHRYGGAGILMDPAWASSFEKFLEDMGRAPTPKHTVDRINGRLGYSKDNCRWATMKEQARNRKDNVLLTALGETKLLCEWIEDARCLVGGVTLQARIQRYGWKPEDAIITPPVRPGSTRSTKPYGTNQKTYY